MKNGMLFDHHDSLPSKYIKGIEQSLGVVFKTKTPEKAMKYSQNRANDHLN